jgi:hypothetical protein
MHLARNLHNFLRPNTLPTPVEEVLIMSRLFVALVLVAAGVVALGFYQGWFQLSEDKTDQKTNITITIDQDKIKEDRDKAKARLQQAGETAKEKVATPTDKAK